MIADNRQSKQNEALHLIMCATVTKLKCRFPIAKAFCSSDASSSPSLFKSILLNHCKQNKAICLMAAEHSRPLDSKLLIISSDICRFAECV